MKTWEQKTYKVTGAAVRPDPYSPAVYEGDADKLARAAEDGWEHYDTQGTEYRLRRRPQPADTTTDNEQ